MIKIEIWASGGGTNADKIISYFKKIPNINVVSLGCNRKDAGAFKVAKKHGIKSIYWDKINMRSDNPSISDIILKPALYRYLGTTMKFFSSEGELAELKINPYCDEKNMHHS